MNLIDSHCHLDFEQFDSDREAVLAHCQQLSVNHILVPGVTENSWNKLITICQQSDMLYPALGLHPMFMDEHQPEHLLQLKQLVASQQPVAIGEIGLDFYVAGHDKQAQIDLFSEQLQIAQNADLPVILHVRKAHDQVISLLKKTPVNGGTVHAFNGSLQQAQQYQKLGFLLGVGGTITYPNSTHIKSLFQTLPLSSLVLETDAPDMPLSGMQQQRNTPENIPLIFSALAQIRTESKEEIASIISQNCQQLFTI